MRLAESRQLNADKVDIVVTTESTGDGLIRIRATVKPKNPEEDLGQAGDSIAVAFWQ